MTKTKLRAVRARWKALQAERAKPKRDLILTLDPGSVNFAWSVMTMQKKVVETGMLPVQMSGVVTHESIQGAAFVIEAIIHRWKDRVHTVVWERYMTRGAGSKNNETVNLVIGLMCRTALQYGIKLGSATMPATWKVWWAKQNDGVKETWYEVFADDVPGAKGKTVHMKDACGIGVWYIDTKCQ